MPLKRGADALCKRFSRGTSNRSSTAACKRSSGASMPSMRAGPCTALPLSRSASMPRASRIAACSSLGAKVRSWNCWRIRWLTGAGRLLCAKLASSTIALICLRMSRSSASWACNACGLSIAGSASSTWLAKGSLGLFSKVCIKTSPFSFGEKPIWLSARRNIPPRAGL